MSYLYLDASIVLRFLYRQPGHLDLRGRDEDAIASALTNVECLRSLDRARLAGVSPQALAGRGRVLTDLMTHVTTIELTQATLVRAGGPMPTPLGSLDAIHLVSALGWREHRDGALTFATHDRELGRAAQMHGLEVLGL